LPQLVLQILAVVVVVLDKPAVIRHLRAALAVLV
jgi:alkylhydroperoxidase/carboxymuconolactone decarboxylase family protein YurZ